jgi:catechol 2,3-dioxygenase-like lactoylglutathione lyase family enzyme
MSSSALSAAQAAYAAAYRMAVPDVQKLKIDTAAPTLTLAGVHHTARPTWRLSDTVIFYRDVLGLPLVHCISAKGWGPSEHPDFLHFFFDAGHGSTIAFFYYLGTRQPEQLRPSYDPFYMATHTAWHANSAAELAAWKRRLESFGVSVSGVTEHEIIDSIYFQDPNGYPFEITHLKRHPTAADAEDAALTISAAIALAASPSADGRAAPFVIDDLWREKGRLVASQAARVAK